MTNATTGQEGPQAPTTGLAYYDQSEPTPDPSEGCPNRDPMLWFVNHDTGQIIASRCSRNLCPYCVRLNALRRASAIAWARPERAILITLLAKSDEPDPWPLVQRRKELIRRNLRRLDVDPGEWVLHVEPNPRETGYHGHIWQHGSFIPKAALQTAAHRAGCGWTSVNQIRTRNVGAYGLKGLGYGLKGVQEEVTGTEYLRVNGSRLTHQSRGFFRGVGVREAERLSQNPEGESPWHVLLGPDPR